MARFTKEDIARIVQDEGVEFIRLQFADIFGKLKNMTITSGKLEKTLNNRCSIDGAAVEGLGGDTNRSIYLHPDLDTFEIYPWNASVPQGKVARLICDIYTESGEPAYDNCRGVLQRVCRNVQRAGYRPGISPGCEFYLFPLDAEGIPMMSTHENSGYFDAGPNDFTEDVRRDIVLTVEAMGFEVESSHHGMAPAQHEIDFSCSDALTAADRVLTFRQTAKTIAKRHGVYATFMPKPKMDDYGSGMPLYISLEREDGSDAFADPGDSNGLSSVAYSFIAGLLWHMPGMTALLNPLVNSYKRFVPGYEAPITLTWSMNMRGTLIWVKRGQRGNIRILLRSPDLTVNPYLTFSVLLAAGMDGVDRGLSAPKPVTQNLAKMDRVELAELNLEQLPMSLGDAVETMNRDNFVKSVLGEQIVRTYIKAKRREWNIYNAQVTQWELEQYLNKW